MPSFKVQWLPCLDDPLDPIDFQAKQDQISLVNKAQRAVIPMEETSQKEIIVEHAKPVLRKPPGEDPDLPEPQVDASKVVIKEQKPPTPSVEVEIANFKHNSDAAEPSAPKKGFVRPRS